MKLLSIALFGVGFFAILLLFGCLTPFQPPVNETSNQTGNVTEIVCPSLYDPVCGSDNLMYSNSCIAGAMNVTVAYKGRCIPVEVKCTDSDFGKNILEQGTTEKGDVKKTDACTDSSKVEEFYCSNEQITSEITSCPSEYKCEAGKCVKIPPLPGPACTDSDSGTDKFVSGSVKYNNNTYLDACTTVHQVKEYYCQNDVVASTSFVCPTGFQCTSGKCAESPQECKDTDSGKDKSVKGTVTIYKGYDTVSTNIDYCSDNTSVFEYSCSGTNLSSSTIDCGLNYVCEEGKCIYRPCTDSDGGQNLMQYGITESGTDTKRDSCEDNRTVREYYCSNNQIRYSITTCSSGFQCTDGACVAEPQCSDSDFGQNLLLKGTTTKGTASSTDTCTNGNYTYSITEYFCQSNAIQSLVTACPSNYWCVTGACSAEPDCVDSDGGLAYYTTGSVTKGIYFGYADTCNNGSLTEYYCDGKNIASVQRPCICQSHTACAPD